MTEKVSIQNAALILETMQQRKRYIYAVNVLSFLLLFFVILIN